MLLNAAVIYIVWPYILQFNLLVSTVPLAIIEAASSPFM